MSSSIITPDNFNAAQLTASPIKVNEKTGAKSCFLNYNGGKILVQTAFEMRAPYGMNTFTGLNGEKAANPDYSIDLSLDGYDKGGEIADYYNMIKAFENYAIQEGVKNRRQWFKDDDLDLKMVGKMFSSTIKFPKDAQGNPKPYPPTQKVKLSLSGKPEMQTKFYDPEGQPLSETPAKLLGKGSTVTCILQCGGLWFAAGKFGITWRVIQVGVHSSGAAGVADFAFVGLKKKATSATYGAGSAAPAYDNTVDDEAEEAALGSSVAAMMPTKPQSNPMADLELPEDGEEVEPQIVPKKPMTKKKLVIGKK
jgi:hypothetical protein